MRTYRFDLRTFVDDLGGPTACWRRLASMGIPIKQRTVNKWLERGSMDTVYLVNLMAHEAFENGPVDLNRYIVRVDDPAFTLPRLNRPAESAQAR